MNRQICTILLGFVTLLLSLPAATAVYMEKDAEGNTVFTDRPSSEDAKPIELSPPITYKAPAIPNAPPSSQAMDQDSDSQNYQFVSITHPADDSPIRENSGRLKVSIGLAPALKPAHRFVLFIDGIPATEGQSTTLQLQNVDRGTHTLQVQIVDANDDVIISSESVTFHMLRATIPRP
ncbi:MAG: DUF4124 domain-containing protein [Gammaproteobacteria bacterium]|nr:DUF4124 domain-containing protein [Gammaproteobacteria bacterium]